MTKLVARARTAINLSRVDRRERLAGVTRVTQDHENSPVALGFTGEIVEKGYKAARRSTTDGSVCAATPAGVTLDRAWDLSARAVRPDAVRAETVMAATTASVRAEGVRGTRWLTE